MASVGRVSGHVLRHLHALIMTIGTIPLQLLNYLACWFGHIDFCCFRKSFTDGPTVRLFYRDARTNLKRQISKWPWFAGQNGHQTRIVEGDGNVKIFERSSVEFSRETVGVLSDARGQSVQRDRRIVHEKHHVSATWLNWFDHLICLTDLPRNQW